MFDYPPAIHKQDLNHICFLLNQEMICFLRYEDVDLRGMRGMARMVNEMGYEVEFKVRLKKR